MKLDKQGRPEFYGTQQDVEITRLPHILNEEHLEEYLDGHYLEEFQKIKQFTGNLDYLNELKLLEVTGAIEPHLLRAFCYMKMKRRGETEKELLAALKMEPDNVLILRQVSAGLGSKSKYPVYIENLTRLMELDKPYETTYLLRRAWNYYQLKEYDKAAEDMQVLLHKDGPDTMDMAALYHHLTDMGYTFNVSPETITTKIVKGVKKGVEKTFHREQYQQHMAEVAAANYQEAGMQLLSLKSPLWKKYPGAFGSVKPYIQIIAPGQKQKKAGFRHGRSESDVLESALDNLCSSLSHQMSFYPATVLAMPYLVELLELRHQQGDFFGQVRLISQIGICVMTDVKEDKGVEEEELLKNYGKALLLLSATTKIFIRQSKEALKKLDKEDLSHFYMGVLGILGDREAARVLTCFMPDEVYVCCKKCGYCDEDIPLLSEEMPSCIIPAKKQIGKWDGTSYKDTYVWFSNFVHELGDYEEAEFLRYYFGRYTCPECGESDTVINLMKNYMEDMG